MCVYPLSLSPSTVPARILIGVLNSDLNRMTDESGSLVAREQPLGSREMVRLVTTSLQWYRPADHVAVVS
jgi:hypothetical protein